MNNKEVAHTYTKDGERMSVIQDQDGTYTVIGENGEVEDDGFKTIEDALKDIKSMTVGA